MLNLVEHARVEIRDEEDGHWALQEAFSSEKILVSIQNKSFLGLPYVKRKYEYHPTPKSCLIQAVRKAEDYMSVGHKNIRVVCTDNYIIYWRNGNWIYSVDYCLRLAPVNNNSYLTY